MEGRHVDYRSENKMCSFCGRQGSTKAEFVGGFGVMMCVECVDYYHEAIHTPSRRRAMKKPPWDDMTDDELLATLPLILKSGDQVTEFATEWVAMIRRRKISWAQIGKALGISRQAAWFRFSDAEADGDPPSKVAPSRRRA
jgi:hypothetical protein